MLELLLGYKLYPTVFHSQTKSTFEEDGRARNILAQVREIDEIQIPKHWIYCIAKIPVNRGQLYLFDFCLFVGALCE